MVVYHAHERDGQILQNVVAQCKKLEKAAYVASIDKETQKVAHVNYVPPAFKAKGLDAREWAGKVTDIIGGKVGASKYIFPFQI